MKAVLISINPKWCELIANGKKTVEVRKTKPKLDVPFKCYIYCTIGGDWLVSVNGKVNKPNKVNIDLTQDSEIHELNGKVIGEFVCNYILPFRPKALLGDSEIVRKSCVKVSELIEYAPNKPFPNDHIYAWHITDLVIYDKPKELGEFYVEGDCDCLNCKKCYWFDKGNGFNVEDDCNLAYKGMAEHKSYKSIIRPPQSWCYVEEFGV